MLPSGFAFVLGAVVGYILCALMVSARDGDGV